MWNFRNIVYSTLHSLEEKWILFYVVKIYELSRNLEVKQSLIIIQSPGIGLEGKLVSTKLNPFISHIRKQKPGKLGDLPKYKWNTSKNASRPVGKKLPTKMMLMSCWRTEIKCACALPVLWAQNCECNNIVTRDVSSKCTTLWHKWLLSLIPSERERVGFAMHFHW